MKTKILIFFFLLISNLIWTQETTVLQEKLIINRSGADTTASDLIFPLKLNPGDRYLVDQNNKPFMWIGDAGWSLFVQISTADAKLYIDNRASKGFNVILSNVLEHYFTTNPPKNYYGQSPFTGVAFQSSYNDKYFAHIDTIVRYAQSKNIMMFLFPVYLGYAGGDEGFVQEINAATNTQMTTYGNYIGNRYKDFSNILWCNGGDRNPTITPNVVAKLNAWAAGVQAYDQKHLMTAHNNSESYGINYWNNPSWLMINNVYTRSKTIHTWYKTAYDVTPVMPFFMIEGDYEHAPTNPEWTPQEMRYPEYSAMLCGGMGYIFGNCPMFGFGFPVFGETDWKPAMDRTGSVDMSTFRKFFKDRRWDLLIPDWTHTSVIAGYGTYGNIDYAPAARTSDGSSIIAYLPTSRTVTVDMTRITATGGVDCQWFNPATGVYTSIGNFPNTGSKIFTPPAAGDWVLVLDQNMTNPTGLNIVFQDDFEAWNIEYFNSDTVYNKWQSTMFEWFNEYNNQIVNAGGTNGKAWRMDYPANSLGSQGGFGFGIPLGDNYTEMWLSQDVYVPSGFNYWNESLNGGGGKILPGFAGGPQIPIPYSVLPAKADPLKVGWMFHGTFVSMDNGATCFYNQYAYWNNMYDIWDPAWGSAVYGTGASLYGCYSPGTGFHNYTARVVLNDVGKQNGFIESFWDGQLKGRWENMEFRTAEADAAGITKYIDKIFEGFWFGGGTKSDAPNWIMYDNICAYQYLPNHPDYRVGFSTKGITPVKANGHKYAKKLLFDETFTTNSGTIHAFKGSWMCPSMSRGKYITKTINVTGAKSIHIDFKDWFITTNYMPDYPLNMQTVKIRNSAKQLLYTLDANNKPTSNGYDIAGSVCYIEYYGTLSTIDGGWTIAYTTKF